MENENKTVEESIKTFTQEDVNDIVSKRLEKEAKKWQEKYSGYYSEDDLANKTEELNKKITELGNSLEEAQAKSKSDIDALAEKEKTIEDLKEQIKQHETASVKTRYELDQLQIGLANGVPLELCNRIQGSNSDEMKEDALRIAQFISKPASMPARNPESHESDGVMAAFKALNPNIKI